MSSPKKRSPCQRYNKDTDECDTCTPMNNKVPFRNCVKYTEYKGIDLFLELVWRVYQQVECMDLECRESRGEGHRLRLVYIFRELHKVHGVNTLNMIKESFRDTFGNVVGEYYYNWLVIELEGENNLPEDLKIDEDYEEEYPVNMFEVLDVEDEPEDYFTPTIDYNELLTRRQKKRKRRPSQEVSVPSSFLRPIEDNIFSSKNKFLKYVIERVIAFNVYAGDTPDVVYRAIHNYPDNLFFPIIFCATQIRIMSDSTLSIQDSMRITTILDDNYKTKLDSIIHEIQVSNIESARARKPLYNGEPTSSLTLLIFRYIQFIFIEYVKKTNEYMQNIRYTDKRAERIQRYKAQRKEVFKDIMLHKDANTRLNSYMMNMFETIQSQTTQIYTNNDVDDVLMRFVNIYLQKSDIKDSFVKGFIFRILKSQRPIMDYNWILENAPTLK